MAGEIAGIRKGRGMTDTKRVCHLFPEHGEREWRECWQCYGERLYGHDCGEDCCCGVCGGRGGWWRCYTCAPLQEDEA